MCVCVCVCVCLCTAYLYVCASQCVRVRVCLQSPVPPWRSSGASATSGSAVGPGTASALRHGRVCVQPSPTATNLNTWCNQPTNQLSSFMVAPPAVVLPVLSRLPAALALAVRASATRDPGVAPCGSAVGRLPGSCSAVHCARRQTSDRPTRTASDGVRDIVPQGHCVCATTALHTMHTLYTSGLTDTGRPRASRVMPCHRAPRRGAAAPPSCRAWGAW